MASGGAAATGGAGTEPGGTGQREYTEGELYIITNAIWSKKTTLTKTLKDELIEKAPNFLDESDLVEGREYVIVSVGSDNESLSLVGSGTYGGKTILEGKGDDKIEGIKFMVPTNSKSTKRVERRFPDYLAKHFLFYKKKAEASGGRRRKTRRHRSKRRQSHRNRQIFRPVSATF